MTHLYKGELNTVTLMSSCLNAVIQRFVAIPTICISSLSDKITTATHYVTFVMSNTTISFLIWHSTKSWGSNVLKFLTIVI